MSVRELVRERAHRFGAIPFDHYMEIALYAPGVGFYESGGAAGTDVRGGDFLTSPSVGPLFGAVLARALDGWWRELGEPDPFVVVEAAAGTGELCRAVLGARPACLPALRYLLVERSERLRAQHPAHLPIEPPAHVLGPVAPADEDDLGARVLPGGGPRIASLPDLPAGPVTGVILANELLDNIPFAMLERATDGWREVRVDADLQEELVPAATPLVEDAERFAPDAKAGSRIPLQQRAGAWLRDSLRVVDRGRVVAVDYAASTAQLAERPWREWVRTYRGGALGASPYERAGDQDITCEVCVDQLERVAPLASDRTQAEFLGAHGIDELVEVARAQWQSGASRPSLEALKAKSRVGEAAALTDPSGLGGFRVLEWTVA
jgi:SAM-dependent MidA family methyltransferase